MENRSTQANPLEPINGTRCENCPHIGLMDDPVTFSGFPTQRNACHHVDPVSIPNLFHQRSVCLSPDYVDCPIFKNGPGARMPKAIQYQSRGLSNQTKQLIMFLGVGAFTLALVFGLLFVSQRLPSSSVTNAPTETQTGRIFIETAVQPTPEKVEFTRTQVTPTPTDPLPTATQAATTPTLKPQILALDTPIGDAVQFIIHSVVEGETLQLYADEYNTTVDAIKAVNYDLLDILWVNWIIIIPNDITDVEDLPAFEAYMVQQPNIALRELAIQLAASPEEMALYNNIDIDTILKGGQWLLVPRDKPEP